MRINHNGVSLNCDVCNTPLDGKTSYTWIIENEKNEPANRRFCSVKCLTEWEGKKE